MVTFVLPGSGHNNTTEFTFGKKCRRSNVSRHMKGNVWKRQILNNEGERVRSNFGGGAYSCAYLLWNNGGNVYLLGGPSDDLHIEEYHVNDKVFKKKYAMNKLADELGEAMECDDINTSIYLALTGWIDMKEQEEQRKKEKKKKKKMMKKKKDFLEKEVNRLQKENDELRYRLGEKECELDCTIKEMDETWKQGVEALVEYGDLNQITDTPLMMSAYSLKKKKKKKKKKKSINVVEYDY